MGMGKKAAGRRKVDQRVRKGERMVGKNIKGTIQSSV